MGSTNGRLTWMVVEDDHAIRDIIITMCELWGFNVIAFRDGYEASDYLKNPSPAEPLPAIALLDIRVPGPWGHELGAMIRQHPRLKDIAVILMTAYELGGMDEEVYVHSAGADGMLYKPLPPMDEMLDIIRRIAAKRATKIA
ncbi:MAG TPA: response regulator [Aggregatilineales bacterium]|nr:response regulator [Aggregatilineales bacterium]